MIKKILLIVFGFILIIILNLIPHFFSNIVGLTIHVIIISLFILPNLPAILSYSRKQVNLNELKKIISFEIEENGYITGSLNLEKYFNRLYQPHFFNKNKTLDESMLENMNSFESGLFLLTFQFYFNNINISPSVQLSDFIKCADRASKDKFYQYCSLKTSLLGIFPEDKDIAEKISQSLSNDSHKFLPVRIPTDESIYQFQERLKISEKETIYYFSTTSQISNASYSQLLEYKDRIKELHFFIIDPLFKKNNALDYMNEEYNVPNFLIPKGQFVSDKLELDIIRRVFRISVAIENLLELQQQSNIDIKLHLYKRKYPGIKIVLFENLKYVQVKVGSLRYANNIYRFGKETTDSDIVSTIQKGINEFIKSDKIETIKLSKQIVDKIIKTALNTAFKEILLKECSRETFNLYAPNLRILVNNAKVNLYIDYINNLYIDVDNTIFKKGEERTNQININERIYGPLATNQGYLTLSNHNELMHISVGMVFIKNQKILLIKKKKKAYNQKYSIVAGHLENGESPIIAIKREVKEEIGLDLNIEEVSLLKYFENIKGDVCGQNVSNHRWYVFLANQIIDDSQVNIDKGEIIEYEWVKFEDIKDKTLTYACERILQYIDLI